MTFITNHVTKVLCVIGLAAAGLAVAPGTAGAYVPAPPCLGASCNGKDPYIINREGINCVSSAYTVTSFSLDHGFVTIALRFSPYCQANWADAYVKYQAADGGEMWVQNKNNDEQATGWSDNPYGTYWTNMVNGIPKAQACTMDSNTYTVNPGCTGWY